MQVNWLKVMFGSTDGASARDHVLARDHTNVWLTHCAARFIAMAAPHYAPYIKAHDNAQHLLLQLLPFTAEQAS